MKATELRIGNYIYDDFNEVHKVECIKSDMFVSIDTMGSEQIIFSKINNSAGLFVCDEVKPIPLTEEWLLKFVAKKSGIEYKLKASALEITIRINAGQVYCEFGNVYLGGRIQYVHELQNLVHSLCGKELEVNP